ncbi:unnamed protein product [Pleuronectes platessa]|uniref:Uncharacterized protein n=1 Tax=Pleuronectes platessa TaxID=8262 RepID=A0A9N7YBM6_PLEPL|nr:unnamed protein product [Pleuronectes platessa]
MKCNKLESMQSCEFWQELNKMEGDRYDERAKDNVSLSPPPPPPPPPHHLLLDTLPVSYLSPGVHTRREFCELSQKKRVNVSPWIWIKVSHRGLGGRVDTNTTLQQPYTKTWGKACTSHTLHKPVLVRESGLHPHPHWTQMEVESRICFLIGRSITSAHTTHFMDTAAPTEEAPASRSPPGGWLQCGSAETQREGSGFHVVHMVAL